VGSTLRSGSPLKSTGTRSRDEAETSPASPGQFLFQDTPIPPPPSSILSFPFWSCSFVCLHHLLSLSLRNKLTFRSVKESSRGTDMARTAPAVTGRTDTNMMSPDYEDSDVDSDQSTPTATSGLHFTPCFLSTLLPCPLCSIREWF
jgi:hypothetical protein